MSARNPRAVNSVFQAVDSNNFKLILNCEVAKRAWTTLEVAFEGTAIVKRKGI